MISLGQPDLAGNEAKYVLDTLKNNWLTSGGSYHKRFERELSKYLKAPALAVTSGTSAFTLALLALGVKPDDEVIVPNICFGSIVSAIKMMGAKPVFVDVRENGILDSLLVEPIITKNTAAIAPVHLYGEEARTQYAIPVIEDSCEAFGIVPPSGDFTVYSFYANKIITTGEGGAILAKEPEMLDYVRKLRDGGFDEDYRFTVPGLNFCMTSVQAAIGVAQLERVRWMLKARLDNAQFYKKNIKGFGKWFFVAEVKDPVRAKARLFAHGIESRRVFCPMHLTPAFGCKGEFPVSEFLWNRYLCIPTAPHVTREQQEKICEILSEPDRRTQPARAA